MPDGDNSMVFMAILPMMLIGTILVITALDRRGFLGPPLRQVSIAVPMAVVASSLSLGVAAVQFASLGGALETDRWVGLYALGVGMFHLTWAQLHLLARSTWSAAIGAVGTAVAVAGSLVLTVVGSQALSYSSAYVTAFQVALIFVVVPPIAPALAALMAEQEMPMQRAVVLGTFGVAVVAMFTGIALIGGALPLEATAAR